MRRSTIVVLMVMLALIIAGCGTAGPTAVPTAAPSEATSAPAEPAAPSEATSAPAESAAEQTLRIRIGSDVTDLDPATMFAVENQSVLAHIYNGLVKYDEATNEFVPDLAERWEVSDDGTIYTFTLRPGVMWHKGYGELTSEDVKYTIERVQNPDVKSRYAAEFANIASVETPDPLTVRITLNKPAAGFLHKVAAFNQGLIVNQQAIEEKGDQYALDPIGTGPFMFESYSPGNETVIVANPDYFGGPPAIDRVVFKLIREETSAEVALKNGEIDVFFALQNPTVIERLRSDPAITVSERDANNVVGFVLNTTVPPLDNPLVRQAIMHAINRPGIVEGFFQGTKSEAVNILNPNFAEFSPDVPQYPYDPERAKALLAEAGVPSFDLELNSVALQPYDQLIVLIAEDLRQIGINPTVNVLERAAYNQARASGDAATVITTIVGPPDPEAPLWRLYHSASFPPGLNTARYTAVDSVLEQAQVELDATARNALYADALSQTMTDVPVVPLYSDRLFLAYRNNISGITQNSLFTIYVGDASIE